MKNKYLEKFKFKSRFELEEILDTKQRFNEDAINAASFLLNKLSRDEGFIKIDSPLESPKQDETSNRNETVNLKFYSAKAISLATFFGGPLAAGYLVGENYKALENNDAGRKSLIYGILTTIVLFAGIFILPENVIDKVPQQIIPLIYTGIIMAIVEWQQGDILKRHKEKGNSFYSGWKAAGVGFISTIIIILGLLSVSYLSPVSKEQEIFQNALVQFENNERESLKFYENYSTKSMFILIRELNDTSIPKWKENVELIKKTNETKNFPLNFIKYNKLLLEYAEMRLELFELTKNAILANSDKYNIEMESLDKKMSFIINSIENYELDF